MEDASNSLLVDVDRIPQLIWVADVHGELLYVNSECRRFFGRENAPDDWGQFIHEEDREPVNGAWQTALATGAPLAIEARFKRADGEYRWLSHRAVAVLDSARQVEHWLGVSVDVEEQRRLVERVRRVAETFQQAALPQRLPVVPGIGFDCYYRPARDDALVGGDWYDAVKLPDGRIVISIGDVSGSGLEAAVTMSAIRQIIRGIAQVHADPRAILDAADRTLKAEHPDRMVTALVGVLDPIARTFTYASAGHPPPLLRYENGTVRELEAHDLPLGLRLKTEASSSIVDLPERAVLVFYTDGLTESTRDVLEGERRLHEVVRRSEIAHHPRSARAISDAMLSGGTHDDVVILTVQLELSRGQRSFEEMVRRWGFESADAASAAAVRSDVANALRKRDASESAVVTAELILSELIANVVRHAPGPLEVVLDLSDQAAVLHVLDCGSGFSLAPRLPSDLLAERGRGLYMVWSFAEDFNVTKRADGGAHARVVLATRYDPESQPAPRIPRAVSAFR